MWVDGSPLTAKTRVRISVGAPKKQPQNHHLEASFQNRKFISVDFVCACIDFSSIKTRWNLGGMHFDHRGRIRSNGSGKTLVPSGEVAIS